MDIIKRLLAILPSHWSGKHDKHRIDEVLKVTCGLHPLQQEAWVKVDFMEGGVKRELMATSSITGFGKRGGNDHITLDGLAVGPEPAAHDDFVCGTQFHLAWPPTENVVIAFKYTLPDGDHRYEFQAPIPISLPI